VIKPTFGNVCNKWLQKLPWAVSLFWKRILNEKLREELLTPFFRLYFHFVKACCVIKFTDLVCVKIVGYSLSDSATDLKWVVVWFRTKCVGEGILVHALKASKEAGSRGVAPLILNLSTRWRWVVNFTPWPLYLRERTPGTYLIEGCVGPRVVLDVLDKRKISCPCGDSNPWLCSP
jgi:hypothetical protein